MASETAKRDESKPHTGATGEVEVGLTKSLRGVSANTLRSFGLANFKALGAVEQQVPIRPLTLVFGANSSGKSSIIHFLLWMKDVVEGKGLDIYQPGTGGTSVDLGGFRQIRHGTSSETVIRTHLHFSIRDSLQRDRMMEARSVFAACQPPADYAGRLRAMVTKRFNNVLSRNPLEALLKNPDALEYVVVDESLRELLALEYGEHTLERHLIDSRGENEQFTTPRGELREANCPKLCAKRTDFLSELFGLSVVKESDPSDLTAEEVLSELQALAAAVLTDLKHNPPPAPEGKPSLVGFELWDDTKFVLKAARSEARQLVLEQLDVAWLITFKEGMPNAEATARLRQAFDAVPGGMVFDDVSSWLPGDLRLAGFASEPGDQTAGQEDIVLKDFFSLLEGTPEIPGVFRQCGFAVLQQFRAITYLGPLRTYPIRAIRIADLPIKCDPEGLYGWRLLHQNEALRNSINELFRQKHLNLPYEVVVDDQIFLAEFRRSLQEMLHARIASLKKDGDDLAQMDLEEQTDKNALYEGFWGWQDWDDQTMIREVLDLVSRRATSESTGTIFMRDLRTGKQVSSRDIGVGVSQLVPVLVQAKAATGEFIAIEQPELHLHPALQAELGDVFIESALKQGNTFLIETHSEHLILRLLRRIRETASGTLEQGKTPLTPDQVSVLYVEPGPEGAQIIPLPVSADGDFERPWPNGFFAERAKELF